MRLAIVSNDELKVEFTANGISNDCVIDWVGSADELPETADAFFDFSFEENGYNTNKLLKFLPKPVFIQSINKTVAEIGSPFIRINAWPTFLKRPVAEIAGDFKDKASIENILSFVNRKTEWVPDIKGFISTRVISMIINEAYYSLDENVSTKEDIDTAMKLGTNYPYGPFEWSQLIGLKNIAGLLTELSRTEKRYSPSSLLLKEAGY